MNIYEIFFNFPLEVPPIVYRKIIHHTFYEKKMITHYKAVHTTTLKRQDVA